MEIFTLRKREFDLNKSVKTVQGALQRTESLLKSEGRELKEAHGDYCTLIPRRKREL